LDPLISADSVIATDDNRFLLTVNAGSDTITSFAINSDFSLTKTSTISSGGIGPNSLAYSNGRVFVSNIDRDGLALGVAGTTRGEPNDEGNVTGFSINNNGILTPLPNSTFSLDNRPADVGFSADGSKLIVSSITAGSAALPGENAANSISVLGLGDDGSVTGLLGAATGTQVGNEAGRNLASAIDFDTTVINGNEFVVVTEAREFNSEGAPPALPALQSGSVSVYQLNDDGSLTTTTDDFATGDATAIPFADGNQLTACWIDFGADGTTFYVSNAITSSISSFELLEDGTLELIDVTAAEGISGFANGATTGPEVFGTTDGFIDLDVSDDGEFLYQLEGLSGNIGVYSVDIDDASLTLLQEVSGFLPSIDTQGIVSVSAPVPEPSSNLLCAFAALGLLGLRRRR
jgi:6-phosphogluconolactonase (cycloisomerase 2 family)